MAMTQSKEIRWIRLGDFIVVLDETNKRNLTFPVMGLNKDKQMMPTVANLDGVNLSKYKLVDKGTFVFSGMQTGRDVCIRIVLSTNPETVLVSPAYTTFIVNHNKKIVPEYLFIWFDRSESDRYGWFISDSSVRSNLDWPRFLDIKIPIPYKNGEPDVERQQEIVDIWQGLRRLKEENEAIAQPLLDICQAKMDELKHSAPMVALGEYIEQTNILNSNIGLGTDSVMGMTITKEVIPTKARISDTDISKFKVVYPGQFIYNPRTHGAKIGLGLNQNSAPFLISWNNISFKIIGNNSFNPTFLYLWFCRSEWDREACFRSWGSSTEVFAWKEFITMKIPKPSIEVQRAIVDIYHCARRAKKIAEEATQQLKAICPALMQYIIHS